MQHAWLAGWLASLPVSWNMSASAQPPPLEYTLSSKKPDVVPKTGISEGTLLGSDDGWPDGSPEGTPDGSDDGCPLGKKKHSCVW
jgi:hypothetical protein